jgi:F-box protein 9
MNNEPVPENAAELDAFRRRWREEVQSRNRDPQVPSSPERLRPQQRRKSTVQARPAASGSAPIKRSDEFDNEELAPKPYHDLPDKEEALKLGVEGQGHDRARLFQEPSSALEHYEKAVEKESHGQLGDSLKHYRTAFKVGPTLLSSRSVLATVNIMLR